MKKMTRALMLILCMGMFCIGCGDKDSPSSLTGEWENSAGYIFTFYESGDFTHDAGNSSNNFTGTYEIISESELKLMTKRHDYICSFSISGSELTIDCGFMGKGEQAYNKQ